MCNSPQHDRPLLRLLARSAHKATTKANAYASHRRRGGEALDGHGDDQMAAVKCDDHVETMRIWKSPTQNLGGHVDQPLIDRTRNLD